MVHIVTGGAGFIGSHLTDALIRAGHHVVVVDDLSTGHADNINPRAQFIHHRIGHDPPRTVTDWAWRHSLSIDAVWHLACPASPPAYQADPVGTLLTAVNGTRDALDWATHAGAPITITSTSEVYGSPLQHPQREDYWGNVNPTGPRACYDEGKRAAEALTFDYHRTLGTNIRVARVFNTYGPRMRCDDGRVISTFIHQATTGQPLTIYGDGTQTRSFCYITDLVDALLRLGHHPASLPYPINLGNPAETTIAGVAGHLANCLNTITLPRTHLPLPADDPPIRQPDITQAIRTLGWKPTTTLAHGLTATLTENPCPHTTSQPTNSPQQTSAPTTRTHATATQTP